MTENTITCAECGNQFKHFLPGRKPKSCSDECKASRYNRKHREAAEARRAGLPKPPTKLMRQPCEGCGSIGGKKVKGLCAICSKMSRKGMRVLERRRQRGILETMPCLTVLTRRIPESQCNVCEKYYRPKAGDRTTTCSRECGFVWSGFKTSALANGFRVSVSARRSTCVNCGSGFTRQGTAKLCSEQCRSAYNEQRLRDAHEPKSFDCAECGCSVATDYGDKRSVYCSEGCLKRATRRVAHGRRRAVLRAASVEAVNPNKVFERDGWRCQSCRVKTPRIKRGTYSKNAPELDHIMPLSLGGEHSYRNTQCLCRACNAAKSNTPMGQLSLL